LKSFLGYEIFSICSMSYKLDFCANEASDDEIYFKRLFFGNLFLNCYIQIETNIFDYKTKFLQEKFNVYFITKKS
jgi:hypothetical protein